MTDYGTSTSTTLNPCLPCPSSLIFMTISESVILWQQVWVNMWAINNFWCCSIWLKEILALNSLVLPVSLTQVFYQKIDFSKNKIFNVQICTFNIVNFFCQLGSFVYLFFSFNCFETFTISDIENTFFLSFLNDRPRRDCCFMQ